MLLGKQKKNIKKTKQDNSKNRKVTGLKSILNAKSMKKIQLQKESIESQQSQLLDTLKERTVISKSVLRTIQSHLV